jgi:hypothetical protein
VWPGAWSSRDHDATRRRPPGADSEEKHEPVSDIATAAADSLKVLDLLTGRLEKKHEPVSGGGSGSTSPTCTLPRVVSGVALPYNFRNQGRLQTGLAACGSGEEQDHAAE